MADPESVKPLVTPEFLQDVSRRLADAGKLVEVGWVSLRLAAIPADAPEIQLREMRMAYMAGAQHLFSSIMTVLDPGDEPSNADLRRMDLIADELAEYATELCGEINQRESERRRKRP